MRLFNFLASQPWAITPDFAKRMVEIYDLALERKARGEELDKNAVEKELGRPLDNTQTVSVRDGVATIPVEGPIFRRADMFTDISGATTIDTLAKDFDSALNDPAIKGIILKIDSPGGEVNGTNEFADHVFAARGQKPVIAYIEHSGASAAYWIASAADEVVIDATASLGSIGVVAAVRDPNKENKKDIEFVSSQSPNKRPDPTTESGKAQIQALVDDLAQVFVESVARNRNVNAETVVKDFGGGGLLVGQKAVDAGLADRVGSYESILTELQNGKAPSVRTSTKSIMREMPTLVAGATLSILDNGDKTMSTEKTKGFFATMFAKLNGDERKEALAELGVENPSGEAVAGGAHIYTMPPPTVGTIAPIKPHVFVGDVNGVCQVADCGEKSDHAAHEESAEVKELRAKAALADKYAAQIKDAREKEAKAFAGSLVLAHVLLPAGIDKITVPYIQAAEDDEKSPLAIGSRVEQFKASFDGLPKHALTSEFITADMPAGAMALNPDAGGSQEDSLKTADAAARAWAVKNNPKPALSAVN